MHFDMARQRSSRNVFSMLLRFCLKINFSYSLSFTFFNLPTSQLILGFQFCHLFFQIPHLVCLPLLWILLLQIGAVLTSVRVEPTFLCFGPLSVKLQLGRSCSKFIIIIIMFSSSWSPHFSHISLSVSAVAPAVVLLITLATFV